MIEEESTNADWEKFQNKLLNAKSAHKGKEGKGPRYAVYDFQYELEGGEGTRYAVCKSYLTRCNSLTLLQQEQDCLHLMES